MNSVNKSPTPVTANNANTRVLTYLGYIMLFTAFLLLGKEAWAFDLEKGMNGATAPLIGAVQNHWGKLVLLAGVVTALIGQGDLRTRAINAGIGVGAASGIILGILAAYT